MKNQEIADALEETANLLEIQGANSFRVRAYRNAARTIGDIAEEIHSGEEATPEALMELPGIGKDIALKISQLINTGSFPLLNELRTEVPAGLLQVLHLPGVGPKKTAVLYQTLGIRSLDDLKAAALNDQIAGIKGFGKKTQQTILEGLENFEQTGIRYLISEARFSAQAILDDLKQLPSVKQAEVAGSCRRHRESCGDLDVLVSSDDSTAVMDRLANHSLVKQVLSRGETKQRVRLNNGIELDLRVVPESSFGAALVYFTGSKEHNIVIRRRAIERGLKINEYGVFRDEEQIAGATEEEVYSLIDLPWIPPVLREDRGEIELAEQNRLPNLVTLNQIKGDLHLHTTATDGTASIREMIEAARERGLSYIAITDHSKRVSMAHGLDAERLRAHWEEIRKIREEYSDIHVMCGIECDILEDATMDLDDDVLSEADWVIAVLHYGLRQPREQIMKRLLNAVKNPYVCAIGHPTGRMVGRRQAADIDFTELFKAAADHGVMMEINANPYRLDLDDIQAAAAARDYGIPIVIDTDSHSTQGYDLMEYGIHQAQRAGLTANEVANTRSYEDFRRLLRTHP